jgi:hypothetical protein
MKVMPSAVTVSSNFSAVRLKVAIYLYLFS